MSAGGSLKRIGRLSRANSHPSLLDDSCCLGVGVQSHNAVNGIRAPNSFSRHLPANSQCASDHNRMDECGGCGVPLRSMLAEPLQIEQGMAIVKGITGTGAAWNESAIDRFAL